MSNGYRVLVSIALALALFVCSAQTPAFADKVEGAISSQPSDRPDLGAYKYIVDIDWDTSRGLSHWDLLLGFLDCLCEEGDVILFASPAGVSEGNDKDGEKCEVSYEGELACEGDPSTDSPGPLLKYQPSSVECAPGKTGKGTFCFYSDLPPGPDESYEGAVLVKNGRFKDYGDLKGTAPSCETPNATDQTSWGRVKTIFR